MARSRFYLFGIYSLLSIYYPWLHVLVTGLGGPFVEALRRSCFNADIQESSTYLKVNHISMWGSVLEWVWLAFMSVNWCIVKPSLNFVKPCVIKLRYVTISKRWKLWFIPHPKYHIWLQKDTSWRGIYISFK